MIGRSETYIKWLLYSAATVLMLLLQGFLLQYLRIFGAMPFLYPALAAVLAMYEGPMGGTVYSLVLGVLCDLTLPGPIPCFYTLIFPAVGLCAGLVSKSWLPAGLPCALAVSAAAFAFTGCFHALLLAVSGKAAWAAAGSVTLREGGATLLFVPLVSLLFRKVYQKCHIDD